MLPIFGHVFLLLLVFYLVICPIIDSFNLELQRAKAEERRHRRQQRDAARSTARPWSLGDQLGVAVLVSFFLAIYLAIAVAQRAPAGIVICSGILLSVWGRFALKVAAARKSRTTAAAP